MRCEVTERSRRLSGKVFRLSLLQALIHGLNRHYYSISISYRKNELEEQMLMNLQKKTWTQGLAVGCVISPHKCNVLPNAVLMETDVRKHDPHVLNVRTQATIRSPPCNCFCH